MAWQRVGPLATSILSLVAVGHLGDPRPRYATLLVVIAATISVAVAWRACRDDRLGHHLCALNASVVLLALVLVQTTGVPGWRPDRWGDGAVVAALAAGAALGGSIAATWRSGHDRPPPRQGWRSAP